MGTVVKVALGVLLGGILHAGACGALIVVGAGLEEVGSDDTEAWITAAIGSCQAENVA